MASAAAVSGFLTDQLLLPLALAGGGSFVATDWSLHAATNADIIRRFLAIDIQTEKTAGGDIRVKLSSEG
jgi:RNA 3'-terminal phosphate cyclase (ATP)